MQSTTDLDPRNDAKALLEAIKLLSNEDLAKIEKMAESKDELEVRDKKLQPVITSLNILEEQAPKDESNRQQWLQNLMDPKAPSPNPFTQILLNDDLLLRINILKDLKKNGKPAYPFLTTFASAYEKEKGRLIKDPRSMQSLNEQERVNMENLNKERNKLKRDIPKVETAKRDTSQGDTAQVIKRKKRTQSDFPFTSARQRFEAFLLNFQNKSRMMHYIYGDANGEVKTKGGQPITALLPQLEEIAKGVGTEEEKVKLMDQAVLNKYYQVRKAQGNFDSRLGDALEKYLNSPLGLNIPLKYGIPIPHQITKSDVAPAMISVLKKPEKMYLLLTTDQEKDSFAEKFKKLIIQLSPEQLKTNRREMINNLIRDLENLEEGNKYIMQRKIAETYVLVRDEAKGKIFGSNLATALEKFAENEFDMSKKKMEKLGNASFDIMLQKLDTQLSKKHLKIIRREVIEDLIRDLKIISKQQKAEIVPENGILIMQKKIAETYVLVKDQAKNKFFGSNLATALEKFFKDEWQMSKKDIEKLGTGQAQFTINDQIKKQK